MLAVSSRDGYCSFVHFEDDELGVKLDERHVDGPVVEWLQTLEKIRKGAQQFDSPANDVDVQMNTAKTTRPVAPEREAQIFGSVPLANSNCPAAVSSGLCPDLGSGQPNWGKAARDVIDGVVVGNKKYSHSQCQADGLGARVIGIPEDEYVPKKKRRITPMVDTSIEKVPVFQANSEEGSTSRLQASAGLLLNGPVGPSKEVAGMFAALTKMVPQPDTAPSNECRDECPEKALASQGVDPMEEDTPPEGLAGLLKGSRFA